MSRVFVVIIPIVIFSTAYDQYSLKAFETNSIDYLLKPVKLERLQQTVNKLKLFTKTRPNQNIVALLKELSFKKENQQMTSITVKKDGKLIFIKLDTISHFTADERYDSVHSKSGVFLSDESLAQLEEKLPNNFIRIHRAIIINKDYVSEVQKYFNSRYVISLQSREKTNVTSSRSYMQPIKDWMNI